MHNNDEYSRSWEAWKREQFLGYSKMQKIVVHNGEEHLSRDPKEAGVFWSSLCCFPEQRPEMAIY
jgi:hypothetical protein